MTDFVGRVDSVFTRQFSASIESAAPAGAPTLTVVDGDDLDPAGQLQTPWDGTIYDYTFDGGVTVTLAAPLASAADAGEIVLVWDPATGAPVVDTVAHVAVLGTDNADDIVEARVSFPLIPLLPEGIRDDENAEAVTVRLDGSDYVVAEVLGQAALIDGAMIDPDTVPPAATDGLAPGSNPTVTLRPGIGSMFVVWEPVDNADPVSYDVYAVPAADAARLAYPPLATDLVGTSDGTGAGFRALPNGTTLTPAGSYAVAVYARDKDGTCTTSATPVTGSPAQVNSGDLALNAVTADHMTANSALFIALQAEDIVGVNITGSNIVGTTIKTADTGNYWRLGSNGVSARIEAIHDFSTGAVQKTSGIENVSSEGDTLQLMGTVVNAGGLVPWTGSEASVGVQASRSRATTSDPWGPQVYQAIMNAHTVGITGNTAQSGDSTPSKITVDAKGTGGYVQVLGEKITLNNYNVPNASVEIYSGDLTLSGDESVVITGPSITIGGQTISDTGWVNISLASGYEAGEAGTPQYRVKNGVVYLRGSVQETATATLSLNSSPGHTIGTLPAGTRPVGADVVFLTPPQNPAANQARLFVWTNGTVKVFLTGTGAAAYVSLTGSYPV